MAGRRKIDIQELIALANQRRPDGKPWTQTEMAEKLGVTRVAVARQLAKLSPSLISSRDVSQYREERADIIAELQQTLIRHITPDKLNRASLSQILMAFGILYDKERLERDQSTQNTAVQIKTSDLDAEDKEKFRELIKEMTQKRLEESRNTSVEENY